VVSRSLRRGRRVFDTATRAWAGPARVSRDEIWDQIPLFRRTWRVCAVIWAAAVLGDVVTLVVMALALPLGVLTALNGAL
jgi:hypothetical protein